MVDTLHWLVNAVSNLAIILLVLAAVGSVLIFLRVFRSDFDLPD